MPRSPDRLVRACAGVSALIAGDVPEGRLAADVTRAIVAAGAADIAAVYDASPPWSLRAHGSGDADRIGQRPLAEQLPATQLVGFAVRGRDGNLLAALTLGCDESIEADAVEAYVSLARMLGVGLDHARLVADQHRERRRAAEARATLESVLESVDTGVSVVDLNGQVRVVNRALLDLFGLVAEIDGAPQVGMFAAARIRPLDMEAFTARLLALQADPSLTDESEWELATDPPRIVKRSSAPMRTTTGEIIGRVDAYSDITESRHLYGQLLNSEKLRAIGEMASGVAHDFNNLLASILGQVELLHPEQLPPATREAVGTIRQSALDGGRIVRNLQGLARPRVETPTTSADLNETVRAAVEMARPRWAGAALRGQRGIDVTLDLASADGMSCVAIDPVELREVLLNLLFNAADAMPDGGSIVVATRPGLKPRTVDVLVHDTGHGMAEAVRARIFEPFFSTKGPRGSGLGLAVAYSIITRRGGSISVESAPEQGTTFTLTLPSGSPRWTEPGQPTAGRSIRGARILVADDEPGLAAIVSQLLERSGATVTVAHGGVAALAALQAPESAFDVVITDLDMPEVDGWMLAAAVKRHAGSTGVVMLTGWAAEMPPEDFTKRGVDVVLAKPCGRADLEAAIADLLSAQHAPGFEALRPTSFETAARAVFEILLVDDEAAFAQAVRDLLMLQGHTVTLVDSAAAALRVLAERRFDVVLTDYSLGEVTGAELAEQIAAHGPGPFVVLITGYATRINDATLLTRGVQAVVPKPCTAEDLRQVLAAVRAPVARPYPRRGGSAAQTLTRAASPTSPTPPPR
jgi:signal transduction histidine kinase/DNA-binding response OmpR family regulator